MREHPIIFSASMVRAILEGRKTQTRRVVKPQPSAGVRDSVFVRSCLEDGHGRELRCPYGRPGQRIWVRETWGIAGDMPHDPGYVEYRADCHGNFNDVGDAVDRWRPSIHMRRENSRITLEITDVRVQRLQDINEEDALAEGVPYSSALMPSGYRGAFHGLWDSINESRGFGWNENPWVWALTFKRVEQSQ